LSDINWLGKILTLEGKDYHMNLKRIFLGACIATMCVAMVGCGKKDKNGDSSYLSKVELGKYKGVEVEKVSAKPTEDAIQQEIDAYLQTIKSTDKKVDKGDTVNIDYVGTINGKEFQGGSYEGYNLKIGSKKFVEGFEEQLIGKVVGKSCKVNVTFPKDYAEDLAGKKAVFTVKINYIAAKKLTDAIVKADDSNDFKTAKEYKDNLITELEEQLEENADSTIKSSILAKIVEKSKYKNIDKDVDKKLQESIEEIKTYYNITIEEYASQMGADVETVKEQLKASAENLVKQTVTLMAIAEKENITLSDKEFDSKIQKTIDEYKGNGYDISKDELYEQLGGEKETREYFLQMTVLDWLAEKAKLVDKIESTPSVVSATAKAKAKKDKK